MPSAASQAVPAAVVITNYNYERYVGAAIESVLAQTSPATVIVVDDGSTDDSVAAIEPYLAANPDQVKLVAKENGGQASAFNAGWEAAKAYGGHDLIVFFLDGDDVLNPSAVEHMTALMARNPDSGRGQFRLGWIDAEGGSVPGSFPEPERDLPAGDLRSQMLRNPDDLPWQPTTGNVFQGWLLDRLLPMPTEPYRISADHYLSNLSALHGPVMAAETELGGYRVHGDNADHRASFDLKRVRDILRRTAVTHEHLIATATELDLPGVPTDSSGFESLTTAALRLVSYRLADQGDGHPFEQDSLSPLIQYGLRAAKARSDFSAPRRAAASAWVLAVGAAPTALIPRLASQALTR